MTESNTDLASGSWQERRWFLLGLTAAAGWLDALAFLNLGQVFNSFMSGNVLFLGIGAGTGDGGRVVRAGCVLVAFVVGTFVGARVVGDRLTPGAAAEPLARALALEAALLTAFGLLWLAIGSPSSHAVLTVVLLVLGAGAMGVQAAVALSFRIPNVATVALTATIAQLGALAGWGARTRPERPAGTPGAALLGLLCLAYLVSALVVALAPDAPILAFGPLALLAAGVATVGGASPLRAGVRATRSAARP